MRGLLTKEIRLQISVTKLKKGAMRLRERIKELLQLLKEKDRYIKELEAKLKDKEAERRELLSYLYKPKKEAVDHKPWGKKPGAPAYHRPPPKEKDVTSTLSYALNECPVCKGRLGDPAETSTLWEEDIVLAPHKVISKHVIPRYWCGHCGSFVRSPHVPEVRRIGIRVLGYLLYARYRLRLPLATIKESLSDLYDFTLSEGEIVAQLKDAETAFGTDYESITMLIQEAKAVYSDETGWRMNGGHWWLWAFVTDNALRFVLEDTRGKGVAERALGTKEDRVIISDGFAAYQKLPGDKQQCWVHLLRTAKLHSPPLYADLASLYTKLLKELEKPPPERDREKFEHAFDLLLKNEYRGTDAHPVKGRMERHKPFLFTCLDHEGVLPENNTAERALRPQVVMRKIFGGSRSVAGARTHAVNTSVLATMEKRHPDARFFDVLIPLLQKRLSGV